MAGPLTVAVSPNYLPIQLTRFVGREQALAELGNLLARTRLLTLTGAPGVGKTRLAFQLAMQAIETYADGVWVVELAPLADPGLVPQAVADVLGLQEQPGRPLLSTLTETLRRHQILLILDNCEHLVTACAELAERLLRSCPHVEILATSREVLGIAGEIAWPVPSLSVPAAAQSTTAADLEAVRDGEAVQLFVDRASAAAPEAAPAPVRLVAARPAGPLSSREYEVASLIAQGRTNRQIAQQLVISEWTVDTHVRHILTKLEFRSRAQVAAWTMGQGLVAKDTSRA